MGLLDTIADTTRNNTRSLGGLLGLGDSGNGLLSDLNLAKRNALSRLRYNVGKNLQSTADYLSGDPNHWMRQPATPEGNAEMDQALMDFGSGLMPGGLAGKIDVSHGSPHKFDRFDFTKIGTGEGAQAYGHGGYFAQGFDSPVAVDYQQSLSGKEGLQSKIGGKLIGELYNQIERKANRLPPEKAAPEYEKLSFLEDLDQQSTFQHAFDRIDDDGIKPWAESLRSSYEPAGHLYNVELKWPDPAREAADPLGEHHLLDWDAPLSEQPEAFKGVLPNVMDIGKVAANKVKVLSDQPGLADWAKQDLLNDAKQLAQSTSPAHVAHLLKTMQLGYGISPSHGPFANVADDFLNFVKATQAVPNMNTGGGAVSYLEALHGEKGASDALRKAGIPGIRYLDQGSRAAGTGSRNFVIFDDRIPQIITRNGKSLLED